MKQFTINDRESGQRFDKYLKKLLKEAPDSFIYKMLRKKNITLNGSKATGKEHLNNGDVIKVFLADDTYEKFAGKVNVKPAGSKTKSIKVVYEDENIIIMNKEEGVLSQKAEHSDISANELITAHLLKNGSLTEDDLRTFRPAVVHRLDRNTTGALAGGKTIAGLSFLSEMFRDRTIHKYYHCIVAGRVVSKDHIKGYLYKDNKTNKVSISDKNLEDSEYIETKYRPVKTGNDLSLLEVELITGKPHQIRAHLSSEGHPIIGDRKYGIEQFNARYSKITGKNGLMLHSNELRFPEISGKFEYLSNKSFIADKPDKFLKLESMIK